jgi:hypothetical protein
VICGHEEPTLGFLSSGERRGVDDKSYKGGCKFVWVPVIHAELKASGTVTSKSGRNLNGTDADHGLKSGGSKIADGVSGVPQQKKASDLVQNGVTLELSLENTEDSISHAENIVMHDGLFNQQKNNSAKDRQFVPKTAIRHYRPRNCDVNEVGCGSVQGKPGSTEAKRAKTILVASSCTNTNKKFESASIHAVSASLYPKVVKSSANTSTPWCDSTSRCGQKILASNVFDEHRVFSAKRGIFTPQTIVCQYMSRNSGGRMIKSATPVTKPGPRWCPTGFTPTQKRRVQRLRASRIRGKRAVKELKKWFSRDRQMVPPKMVWKKKGIVADKNTNADMVADGISEIFRDAATHMDVDQGG